MKRISIAILIASSLLYSCSKDEEEVLPESGLTEYQTDVIDYFKEIALGFEFGNASRITRRWSNDMKIFVGGSPTPELLTELDIIVDDIMSLTTTSFSIEMVSDSAQSNYYIYFGSGNSYSEIFPSLAGLVDSNWGLFNIFWNGSNELHTGYMYVDIYRASSVEQKHLLREELTQSLGLAKDSSLYSESIFQQAFSTKVTEYAEIDKDLIRLLYHPDMRTGLNIIQVDGVLRNILLYKS
jgi:hypothetical protein